MSTKKVTLMHTVRVDSCIAKELEELNNKYNIRTTYSCCGHGVYCKKHGHELAYICVHADDVKKMYRLGYKPSTLQTVDIRTIIFNDGRFSYYGYIDGGRHMPFHFEGPTSFIPKSVCHCKKRKAQVK